MRVLLTIHHHLDRDSGATGSTLQLAEEYRRLGHAVEIWSFDDLPSVLGAREKTILFPFSVGCRLWRACHEFDVVDSSTNDAWLWASLRRTSRPPLLVTSSHGLEHIWHELFMEEVRLHTASVSWKYPLYNGSLHLHETAVSLRRADLALFLNPLDRQYAVSRLGVEVDRAAVVPNGLREEFVKLPFEQTPAHGEIRVAQVGTYIERKGTRYGAKALEECLGANPDVSITFLGTLCSPETVLADFSPRYRDRIQVVPRYRHLELIELLRGFHIKLFPTLYDGFGNALLEAMACGLAPVVTATPGPLEIVRDGIDGLVVPPRNSPALARALQTLIDDRSVLDRLRVAAQRRARSFRWRNLAKAKVELYEQFLERKCQSSTRTTCPRALRLRLER